MTMFRAGLAVAAILIGGAAALLGLAILVAAMKTGALTLQHGLTATETIAYANEPSRFISYVAGLGLLPFIAGAAAAVWGLRLLRGGRGT